MQKDGKLCGILIFFYNFAADVILKIKEKISSY